MSSVKCSLSIGLVASIAVSLNACSAQPSITEAELLNDATARVLRETASFGHAKVVSVSANAVIGRACGWVDLGPPEGIAMFEADGISSQPNSYLSIPQSHSGALSERVEGVYYRQLARMSCERAHALPPTPQGADVDPATDHEMNLLWDDNGPRWAIILVPNSEGRVGVRRRNGGGLIVTPMFSSSAGVEAWLKQEGDALSEFANAEGRKAMAAYDACLAKAPGAKEIDTCPNTGMDTTVMLKPTH